MRSNAAPLDAGRPGDRRGVLLLIALVMLALFLLLGTTFIIVASRRRTCSAAAAVGSASAVAAEETANEVFDDILVGGPPGSGGGSCGPTAQRRVTDYLLACSLLADKYGDAYEESRLLAIDQPVTLIPGSPPFFRIRANANFVVMNAVALDLGPRAGRILSIHNEDESKAVFRIVAEMADPTPNAVAFIAHLVDPQAVIDAGDIDGGAVCTIQGREFTGDPNDPETVHESYDAPDGRNLFLSWVQADAVLGRNQKAADGDEPSEAWKFVVPSFHRPDKILARLKQSAPTFAALLSGTNQLNSTINPDGDFLTLRPTGRMSWRPSGADQWQRLGVDVSLIDTTLPVWTGTSLSGLNPSAVEHPNFTGSNVETIGPKTYYFDPINGPWDVDNDGDGVADSVWLDIGMERVLIDGVECQPLVALMVVDLDCRVNVNAHGRAADAEGTLAASDAPSFGGVSYAGGKASVPAGQGWGVADIDPYQVIGTTAEQLSGPGGPATRVKNPLAVSLSGTLVSGTSLSGTAQQTTPRGFKLPNLSVEGRYGDSRSLPGALAPAPGKRATADTGIDSPASLPSRDAHLPEQFGGSAAGNNEPQVWSIGSPIDPHGMTKVAIDVLGQPIISRSSTNANTAWQADRIDDPYDLSLGRRGPRPGWDYDPVVSLAATTPSTLRDNLFTPSQLERVLRLFEPDTESLPPRLASILGPAAEVGRMTATTDSWDSTAVCVPLARLEPLLDLSDQSDATKPSLISWDLQMGLKMDINRPFGDGFDNDAPGTPGYRIVDEPGEFSDELTQDVFGLNQLASGTFAQQAVTNGRDVDGDGDCDAADQDLARQLYARHLYVLARLLEPNLPAEDAAQWAVNVVDFRDPDSIMTRFEYDNTFQLGSTSWNSNSGNVVWGCERPELLITEAVHWRNIKEQMNPGTSPPQWVDQNTGGLVIELYHPWTGVIGDEFGVGGSLTATTTNRASAVPVEFAVSQATNIGYGTDSAVDLAKVTPNNKDPVFQIVVVREDLGSTPVIASAPTDPTQTATAEVTIYTGSSTAPNVFANRKGPSPQTTVAPGQFAIVAGPIPGGGGNSLVLPIEKTAGDARGLEFRQPFKEADTFRPFDVTSGLVEMSGTGATSTDALQKKRVASGNYPQAIDQQGNATSGPIGAVVLVEGSNPNVPLRLPPLPQGTDLLTEVENGRYRILLRRLANPLEDFNPSSNPYICIDSLVFHDQGVIHDSGMNANVSQAKITLKSSERCMSDPSIRGNNLWRHADENETPALVNGNELNQTPYSTFKYSGIRDDAATIEATLGFLPSALEIPASNPADRAQPPFPWLTWLNREFASVHELLLVPRSSPAMLLRHHTHAWPFGHLFFQLGSGADPDGNLSFNAKLNLERNKAGILEFLRVPSRFADAEQRITPADAVQTSLALVGAQEIPPGKPLFLPPHNFISSFREPGRVNLNTLSSPSVWAAVTNGRPFAPYEDEIRFAADGTLHPDWIQGLASPTCRSEDWLREPAVNFDADPSNDVETVTASGDWILDAQEQAASTDQDQQLDLHDDVNNDGVLQVSGSDALRSIAASRRGWPLTADASPTVIAGQFDRVLNRAGVAPLSASQERRWFTNAFRSGWPASTSGEYEDDASLLLRSWHATRAIRLQVPANGTGTLTSDVIPAEVLQVGNYSLEVRFRSTGVTAAEFDANLVGTLPIPIAQPSGPFPPESDESAERTFTGVFNVPTAGSRQLRISLTPPSGQLKTYFVESVSLRRKDSLGQLLPNGGFKQGLSGWQVSPNGQLVDAVATDNEAGPTYLFATNQNFRVGQGGSGPVLSRVAHSSADPERNPAFRYREIMRLSNLTTPRSNVFAIWATVGFFVVEKPFPDLPTRTALGPEYGLDTGEVVRKKSFSIIDRSIPVGFVPGKRLNSRDAVLFERTAQ